MMARAPLSGSTSGGGVDESYYMHAGSDGFERAASHESTRRRRVRRLFPLLACASADPLQSLSSSTSANLTN